MSAVISTLLPLAGKTQEKAIDLDKARVTIDSLNQRGARLFEAGDSLGMYNMYAADADLGGIRGKQIMSYWGGQIREAGKADMRHMTFSTRSLSTDGEFLIEAGVYTIKGKAGDLKGQGKYLIVWKQEDGVWKLYRDIPL